MILLEPGWRLPYVRRDLGSTYGQYLTPRTSIFLNYATFSAHRKGRFSLDIISEFRMVEKNVGNMTLQTNK